MVRTSRVRSGVVLVQPTRALAQSFGAGGPKDTCGQGGLVPRPPYPSVSQVLTLAG